jgi:hypothetical protein
MPVKNPKRNEKGALFGKKFVENVLETIMKLGKEHQTMSLAQIDDLLIGLVRQIDEVKNAKFDENSSSISPEDIPAYLESMRERNIGDVQFAPLSEAVWYQITGNSHPTRKARADAVQKARAGLQRIHSICLTLLKDLEKLQKIAPDKFKGYEYQEDTETPLPDRFVAQRGKLSKNDIQDFVRMYGDEYLIPNMATWSYVVQTDPVLFEDLTTVINSLNRGRLPRNASEVKAKIKEILNRQKENFESEVKTNESEFTQEDAPPTEKTFMLFNPELVSDNPNLENFNKK